MCIPNLRWHINGSTSPKTSVRAYDSQADNKQLKINGLYLSYATSIARHHGLAQFLLMINCEQLWQGLSFRRH